MAGKERDEKRPAVGKPEPPSGAPEKESVARPEAQEGVKVDSWPAPESDVELDGLIEEPEDETVRSAKPKGTSDANDEEPPLHEDIEETRGPVSVRYFGVTDVGLVREHNEDNFLVADLTTDDRGIDGDSQASTVVGERGAVFAVCDGMGGAAAGEVASKLAVDTVFEVLQEDDPPASRDAFAGRLVRAIEEAGTRIFASAKLDRTRRGMGTTATVAGLRDKVLFVGQVGDSRAYVLRGGQFNLITKDQSLVNQLLEAGQLTEQEAEAFEHSNIILQALGTTEEVTVDLTFLELRRGDRLLLCSDGLSGLVHADSMKEVLETTSELADCCRKLIEMANAGGGHDNITVIVAEFDGEGLQPPSEDIPVAYQQYPLPLAERSRSSLASARESGRTTARVGEVKREWTPPADLVNFIAEHDRAIETAGPSRAFPWWLVAAALVMAAIATVAVLALGRSNGSADADDGSRGENDDGVERTVGQASAGPQPGSGTPDPVQVRVVTDVSNGELYVDGEPQGTMRDSMPLLLHLAPGAYRFEVRTGGNVAASQLFTVEPERTNEISLMLPQGATEVASDESGTVRESGGVGRTEGGAKAAGTKTAIAGEEREQGAAPDQRRQGAAHGSPPPNPF